MVYYEDTDELKDIKANMSVIPSYTLTFSESALYLAEYIEAGYNEMFQKIGINELAVYESTGSQIVYEEGKLSNIVETVVGWLKKAWEGIKGFFTGILNKFEEHRKKSAEKFGNITAAHVDKIEDGKKLGKVHQFAASIDKDEFVTRASSFATEVQSEFEKFNKQDEVSDEDLSNKKDELVKQVCSKLSGIEGVTDIKDMKDKMKKKYQGEGDPIDVTKDFVKKNLSNMVDIVIKGKDKAYIKKQYKSVKDMINKQIKTIKKVDDSKLKAPFKYAVNVLKEIIVTVHSICAVTMDVCMRRYTEYKNILGKVYAYGKVKDDAKADKKNKKSEGGQEKANESYYSRSYQTDLVSEAFDW